MNNFTRALAFAAIVFFSACPAYADTFTGRVVGIMDGDTIRVLTDDREQVKVRLVEIDAPEKKQAFGNRSKQTLSDYCFNRVATLTDKGRDRYGRTLARVNCNGVDVNAEMVRVGMAWVYDKYVTDRSLYALQDDARVARRGLWVDPDPMPPWEWRHRPK